jgi:hypothetical protein
MTSTTTVPFTAPLVGIRLHARRTSGGVPEAGPAARLLDLKEREAQRMPPPRPCSSWRGSWRAPSTPCRSRSASGSTRWRPSPSNSASRSPARSSAALERGLVDPTPTVVRCLRDCVHGSSKADLVVRLHPLDLEGVQQQLAGMSDLQDEVGAARFVADKSVPRGGVRAETGAGRLLYDPSEVLERISAEVRREAGS